MMYISSSFVIGFLGYAVGLVVLLIGVAFVVARGCSVAG